MTHLVELLRAADPARDRFESIVVWASPATLDEVENRPWLRKDPQPLLAGGLFQRVFWQRARLTRVARAAGCDVLFVPGGAYTGDFRPLIAMCRNMLPFERRELLRYGASLTTLKMIMLRWIQTRTFRRADGLVFLTRYARDRVSRVARSTTGEIAIVSHGVDARFARPPRRQRAIDEYSVDRPFRIVYVSTIDFYKHQWVVAEAVWRLRTSGLPVTLELIGRAHAPALNRLLRTLDRLDPSGEFLRYAGPASHAELGARYAGADVCVFASSCENMPNILLEAMASGLPIVCADRGPMPEVLGDAGRYCNPEDAQDIARALRELIESTELRATVAARAFDRAQQYSWTKCANDTFSFIRRVADLQTAS